MRTAASWPCLGLFLRESQAWGEGKPISPGLFGPSSMTSENTLSSRGKKENDAKLLGRFHLSLSSRMVRSHRLQCWSKKYLSHILGNKWGCWGHPLPEQGVEPAWQPPKSLRSPPTLFPTLPPVSTGGSLGFLLILPSLSC